MTKSDDIENELDAIRDKIYETTQKCQLRKRLSILIPMLMKY
jgi:hypothetical protein